MKAAHDLGQSILNKLTKLSIGTVITHRGEDPWVIYWQGNYYYCHDRDDRQIVMHKASKLEDIGKRPKVVWNDPLCTPEAELWAPELHRLENKWYIYFTTGKEEKHRMYALESTTDDPMGPYEMKGKIADPSDQWAIDGTILYLKDKYYFVWSGWKNQNDKTQNLYIAPMSNPWTISGERVCISRPEYDWEKVGAPVWPHINEGPQALEKQGQIFIIYSASHSLTDSYCLGRLTLAGDDPLMPSSWVKEPRPVFSKNGIIYGPGHASFIEKPDGSDWIIYHSTAETGINTDVNIWDSRVVRAQQFSWNKDGSPDFGKPRALKEIKILDRFKSQTQKLTKISFG